MTLGSRLFITVVIAFGLAAPGLAPVAARDGDPGQAPAGADLPITALILAPAAPVIRNYPGSTPCNSTLQACISASADGDTVVIAANTYLTASLSITRAVNLSGGGATPASVKLRPTSGRMIEYSAPSILLTPTLLSNLTVENGSVGAGSGGGIRVLSGSGAPLFQSLVISNNVSTGGGGIRVIPNIPVTLTGVTVFGNKSSGDGGGLSVNGSLYLENSQIEANTAITNGGGAIAVGAIVMSNTRLISNTANTGGGLHGAGAITLTNAFFDKNVARLGNGGAIFAGNAAITVALVSSSPVSPTRIQNSSASADGGGLYAAGGVFIKGEGRFSNNKALNGEGGAFYVTGNLIDDFPNNVDNIWSNNTSAGNGGAIRIIGSVDLCESGPLFQSNVAGGGSTADGGAIYGDGGIFLCTSGTASADNRARNGGAFYGVQNVFLNGHSVGYNEASSRGGCAFSEGVVTFNSASATGCVAGLDGGAASALTVTVQGNGVGAYSLNRAGRSGGMAFANAILVMEALVFSNTAPIGGAFAATSTVDLSDSTIQSNTARSMGGAVAVSGTASLSGTVRVTNMLMAANVVTAANGMGGAIQVTGTAFITGTRLERNRAPGSGGRGGAIFASRGAIITDSAFALNTAAFAGAGYAGGPITVTNSSLLSNTAQNGGGISTTLALVVGSVFTGNASSNRSGGGIWAVRANVRDSRFLSNTNSGFTNSDDVGGGAIYADSLDVERGYFEGNIADEEGSAVYISRTGTITDSVFLRNRSSFSGGSAVFVKGQGGGTTKILSSDFDDNQDGQAVNGGGAIDSKASSLIVSGGSFQNNHAWDGGAIRATNLTLIDAMLYNNVSDCCGSGGALWVGTANIANSTFISNYADCCDGGGAIYSVGFLSIAGSRFLSNTVESRMDGGAINAQGPGTYVLDSVFDSNRVLKDVGQNTGRGGAIYNAFGGNLTVEGSSFTNNQANDGGAMACDAVCEVNTSVFTGNNANKPDGLTFSNIGEGGAIQARDGLIIKRSRFMRNSAGVTGGSITKRDFGPAGAAFQIQNSLFAENRASNTVLGSSGNAVYVTGTVSVGKFLFNTVVSDSLATGTAVALMSGTFSVLDNIFTNHGVALEHGAGGTVFENFNLYSANSQNLSGTIGSPGSSFSATPIFLSPALDLYYLMPGSPGIDAGFDVSVIDDVDGQIRPQGAGFDIGYDEGGPLKAMLPLVVR